MEKEIVPKEVFEKLVKHLVYIEEQQEYILNDYYAAITAERVSFESFMADYIQKVEKYLSSCEVSETINEYCPRIIIGSTAIVEDVELKEEEKYQIISPFENNAKGVIETASYLSPMGKALLLKKPHEEVLVETPVGKFPYKILSIDMFPHLTN